MIATVWIGILDFQVVVVKRVAAPLLRGFFVDGGRQMEESVPGLQVSRAGAGRVVQALN